MKLDAAPVPSSSGDSLEDEANKVALISGILWKWTNFLMGWQERYFELRNGILVYYKSEDEKQFGSRGSITIRCATVEENEEDLTRFEISTNGVAWDLKAETLKSKDIWLRAIREYMVESRRGSLNSRSTPVCPSIFASRPDLLVELKTKIDELEKSRQLARLQVERLQQRINAILRTTVNNVEKLSLKEEGLALDITTAAILRDISTCIDLLAQQAEQTSSLSSVENEGPVYDGRVDDDEDEDEDEEGVCDGANSPTIAGSTGFLSDSEWHDALETEEDTGQSQEMKFLLSSKESNKPQKRNAENLVTLTPSGILSLPPSFSLTEEINRITLEQLRYAKAGVEDNVWELFSEEGEMRMYKMELELDGLVCDPLKATHCVKGVTAREYIHFFYEPKYKEEWDETIERMSVVQTVSPDTCVIHQVHKRVWPTAQRESLFWSHVRQANASKDADAYDLFVVCNHDTQRQDVPLVHSSNVRVGVTVAMLCQTIIDRSKSSEELTRDDIQCRIIYVAQVHPGGWVPSAALRVVYKREYPKFLRGFTKYVIRRLNKQPICL